MNIINIFVGENEIGHIGAIAIGRTLISDRTLISLDLRNKYYKYYHR
jgi:hypothetical protein